MGYPSDVTDTEWAMLEPLLPKATVGHPLKHDRRVLLNAVLYILRTGCPWRYLPRDFPAWSTVSYHFCKWRDRGSWGRSRCVARTGPDHRRTPAAADRGGHRQSVDQNDGKKGGCAATTAARRHMGASGMSPSTPLAGWSLLRLPPPASRMAQPASGSPSGHSRRCRRLVTRGSIEPTVGRSRRRSAATSAGRSRSLEGQNPRPGSSSNRVAGWSSEHWPGSGSVVA